MRRVAVKICGMTREEDLSVAVAAGADAVGFIVGVPSSPRNISLKKAEKLLRLVPIFVKSVLVTGPTDMDALLKTYEELSPDAVQIHGESLPDASLLREKLPRTPLIRAINANPTSALIVASEASRSFDAVLLDSSIHGRYGGTGVVHDWDLSKRINKVIHPKPLILAGGLNPENVRDAIRTVKPYAVDVCTGVESRPGIKDSRKVLAFIENARGVRVSNDKPMSR
jgi:phosphoribosylanthranilate isomerase